MHSEKAMVRQDNNVFRDSILQKQLGPLKEQTHSAIQGFLHTLLDKSHCIKTNHKNQLTFSLLQNIC